ncbi:DCC1-like thiol-disulfide oxidoreductase family protein [Streptomyces sp. NPDC006552]|uniref:thiol-disulfide oxidoreductase DCC family protein n=1 Tax=Streptomyces sp. NPDC006552 TaxID=3157179 RepID=UPI0033A80A49
MTAVGATGEADRDARGDVPVRRLTVLYDAECPLCTFARGWLARQRQLVPLEFVAAGSAEARGRFPGLDHAATLSDITVIDDGGRLYRGPAAWVVCMWALREHRATAHRMATPAGMKVAKQVVLAAAKYRAAHQGRGAGGGAYRRADGWAYDPKDGWYYVRPGTVSASRGAPGAACDSGCRVAD